MKFRVVRQPLGCFLSLGVALSSACALGLDTNRIEKITGLKGSWSEAESVFKVRAPRTGVALNGDLWKTPPLVPLASWAAFLADKGGDTRVKGALALFEDEVNPVISAVLEVGLEVTALHKDAFSAEPQVYFLHLAGEGAVEKLAGGVKAALSKVYEIRSANASPAKVFGTDRPEKNTVNAATLAELFITRPQVQDGLVRFEFGRVARMENDSLVSKEMGLNSWVCFGGGEDRATVQGAFACQENELQSVLKSLRSARMNIVAIQQHTLGEWPRYLFVHYSAQGNAMDLAKSVKTVRGEQTKAAAVAARASGGFKEIGVADFEKLRVKERAQVLDVRSAEEFAQGHITDAINAHIHSPEFFTTVSRLDPKKPILVNCHAGSRGAIAAAELSRLGFTKVFNLEGGCDAWEKAGHHPEKGTVEPRQ